MVFSKTVSVYMNAYNAKRYKSLGYDVHYGEYYDIQVKDLPDCSRTVVKFKCDYCGEIFEREWGVYIRNKNKCSVQKDACQKCFHKKLEDSMFLKYGVKNSMQLEETKRKQEKTNIEKYGCKNALQNEDIKKKAEKTMLEKYGVKRALQNEDIKRKFIKTNTERYGGSSPMCSAEVREKSEATNIEKYGYKNCMQNPEIKNKAEETTLQRYGDRKIGKTEYSKKKREQTNMEKYGCICTLQSPEIKEKAKDTLIKKYGVSNCMQNEEIRTRALQSRSDRYMIGGALVSSQQIYLGNLYKGQINFPFHGYLADIMFVDEGIIVEYSGSGHDIRVKYGQVTKQEFDEKEEVRRNVFLKNGYKEFEIISSNDVLPNDEFLIKLKEKAFDILLNTETNYYGYNLNTGEEVYK